MSCLALFLYLVESKCELEIDLYLAIAQNDVGPKAFKSDDVVWALNGKSIEVVHTDAEGRMVLADAICLAAQKQPELIMTFATLTGTCINSLGRNHSGAYASQSNWVPEMIKSGEQTGERVWPLPSDADFLDELRSEVADLKQCPVGSQIDHILGGIFLQQFTGDSDLLHLDLSSSHNEKGAGISPSGITGIGIGWAEDFLNKWSNLKTAERKFT